MAIHPILTSPAQANNISGKTYIDNGYIRKAYEITVFNNNTTEHFHDAKITGYRWSKRWVIVPPGNGAKLASFVDSALPAGRVRCQPTGMRAIAHSPAPRRCKTCHCAHIYGKHRLKNAILCAHCPLHCVTPAPLFLAHLLLLLCHRFSDSHSEVPPCQTAMIFRSSKRPPPGARAFFHLDGSVQLYFFHRHHVRGGQAWRLFLHR